MGSPRDPHHCSSNGGGGSAGHRMFFRRWRRRPHHDRSRNGSGLTGHHQYPPDGVVHPYSGLIDSITFDPITRRRL